MKEKERERSTVAIQFDKREGERRGNGHQLYFSPLESEAVVVVAVAVVAVVVAAVAVAADNGSRGVDVVVVSGSNSGTTQATVVVVDGGYGNSIWSGRGGLWGWHWCKVEVKMGGRQLQQWCRQREREKQRENSFFFFFFSLLCNRQTKFENTKWR